VQGEEFADDARVGAAAVGDAVADFRDAEGGP
jgi:hypothetical protein